jgi:hypothetical protein
VQPPDHPAARIDTGAPDVSASEHIDQLNRLVASLRAQLEGREVGSKLETVVKVDGPEGQGSLYAQQRSQKLCMRNGGEGTLLPRYLTIKETENPSDNSNSSKKSSHDNVKEKKILFDVSNGTMGTKVRSLIKSSYSPLCFYYSFTFFLDQYLTLLFFSSLTLFLSYPLPLLPSFSLTLFLSYPLSL